MILSDFLLRQKHDDSNPHEIIQISFNMHSVLHDRYYNIGILGKYMLQTQSQAKSSGIKLSEVLRVGKRFRSTYTARETNHKTNYFQK